MIVTGVANMTGSLSRSAHRRRATAACLCLLIAFVCARCKDKQKSVRDDPVSTAPAASELVEAFSKSKCMEAHFAVALQTASPPPEVRFFCAAPWNFAALKSVKAAANQAGFNLEHALVRTMSGEDKEMLASLVRMSLTAAEQGPDGLGAAVYAFKLVPLLHAARDPETAVYAELTKQFHSEDVQKLTTAAATLDWDQPVLDSATPAMKFELYDASAGGRAVELFIAPETNSTLNDLASMILVGIATDQNLVNSSIFGPEFSKWSKLFLPPSLALQLGLLSLQITDHVARAATIGTTPSAFFDRSDKRPLRIYILHTFPDNSCGAPTKTSPANYCPEERHILVQSEDLQEVFDGEVPLPAVDPAPFREYASLHSATLQHEISHAIYDPERPDRMPFLVEGRASSEGEQLHKAIRAALSMDREAAARYNDLFRTAVTALRNGDNAAADAAQRSNDIASNEIAKQKPTSTQIRLLQDFVCSKPDAQFVARQLSLSNASFRAQAPREKRLAYATAWVFHHFGYLSRDSTPRLPRQRLDITALYEYSDAIAVRNVALTAAQTEKIGQWLAELSHLASAELPDGAACPNV